MTNNTPPSAVIYHMCITSCQYQSAHQVWSA